MPSVTVLPDDSSAKLGYHEIAEAFGPGAPGMLQVVTRPQDAGRTTSDPCWGPRDCGGVAGDALLGRQ